MDGEDPALVHLAASCGGATRSPCGTAARRPTSDWSRPTARAGTRDQDVLDTWFSSGLWPFATLGWPEETDQLQAFYPTDALVTSRDIIFHWVARMIMMGLEFTGQIPFSDVYIHSIIQAPDGRRMSKSLGTGIDPLDLINGGPRPPVFAAREGEDPGVFPAYGADAVRWGLLSMSSGQDVRFNEEAIAQGQRLTNKLWNAARLILLGVDPATRPGAQAQAIEDRWILSRLARVQQEVGARIERFDFSRAAGELYDFIYGELCDWYLELVKPRLREGDATTAALLVHVLTETVHLAHPVIPFVTEEIYSHIPGAEGLLAGRVQQPLTAVDSEAEQAIEGLIAAVQAVRGWRQAAEVKSGAVLEARLEATGYETTGALLAQLARLDLNGHAGESTAAVPIPGGTIAVLAAGAVDTEAAARKVAAKRAEIESEIKRAEGKLSNPGFVAKAPPAVVAAEREKLEKLRAELEAL